MAVTGTGLPLPQEREITRPAPVINADAYSAAQAWTQIANSAAKVGDSANNLWRLESHQAQAGYLAKQENAIDRDYVEMRDKFAFDPQGFRTVWDGHMAGKISQMEPWAIPHFERYLGSKGNAGFSAISGETRARDTRLDNEAVTTRIHRSANDYISSAMAGPPDEGFRTQLGSHIAAAVNTGLWSQERADMTLDETVGKAQGEVAAREGVLKYRDREKGGYEAAVEHLRKNILENEGLNLSPSEKRKAFTRGLGAIKLEQHIDREDRVGIVQDAQDTIARIKANQPPEVGEIRDKLAALKRVGAMATYRDLYVESQVHEMTGPYRTGALRPSEYGRVISHARDEARGLTSIPTPSGSQVTVNRQASTAFAGFLQDLAATGYKLDDVQGFNDRNIAGTNVRSKHADGLAIDINPSRNPDTGTGGKLITDLPANVGDIAAKWGLRWGGNFQTKKDAMHFEFVGGTGAPAEPGNVALASAQPETDTSGMPYGGTIMRRVQQDFSAQMRKEWPDFKKSIDAGRDVNPEDFEAVRMGAAVSGDAAWIKDVEEASAARLLGKVIQSVPIGQGQAGIDEIKQKFSNGVGDTMQKMFDRRLKLVTDAPVDFSVESGRKPPIPLDFSSPQATAQGIQERVAIARAVAQDQQIAPGNPFRQAEVATLAGAIQSGNADQASAALGAIGSLPDDMLVPALKNADIRAAITGATRSGDAATYNAAMSFADTLWRRAPATAKEILGEDSVHDLMTWQALSRYMKPEQMAKEREKATLDPQVRERRKVNEAEGRTLARKMDAGEIAAQFDTSWLPGFVSRAVGTAPLPPTDSGTRDALMGDYENIFARRYAETLDKDVAAKQTMELLNTKWARSPLNGGRLMVNAPDVPGSPYPRIDGSWDWMAKQLEDDLTARLGPGVVGTATGELGQHKIWDYTLVADTRTETDRQHGRPLSYQVVVKNRDTGKTDVVHDDGREWRYSFDPGPDQSRSRVDLSLEVERILNPPRGVVRNISGFN